MKQAKTNLHSLKHIIEMIFDSPVAAWIAQDHDFIQQKHNLVYQAERTLALLWEKVKGSPNAPETEVTLLQEMHELVARLKSDLPCSSYREQSTFFGARIRALSKKSMKFCRFA